MHYYNAEIHLYEIGLYASDVGEHSLDRLEILHACLTATKAFLDIFQSLPATLYPALPISVYSQVSFAVIVLYRLSNFHRYGWDVNYVRGVIDCSKVIVHMADRFEETGNVYKLPEIAENNIFYRNAQKLRKLRYIWYKLDPATHVGPATSISPSLEALTESNGGFAGGVFEFVDDSFWQDIVGGLDHLPSIEA
jgi:hypothetical protein